MPTAGEQRSLQALDKLGVPARLVRHDPVDSLDQAARARGISTADIVKTLVVRRGIDDYLFVLVPGDRKFSWPKLRAVLQVNRLSMPDADTAFEVTGYRRGTITPFGASRPWPVIADSSITGREISMGSGAPNVAIFVDSDQMIRALNATLADISD